MTPAERPVSLIRLVPLTGKSKSSELFAFARFGNQVSQVNQVNERNSPMATKICGIPSRRWAAFFLGMLVGTVVVGCSMFGPGLGVSVY